MISLRTRVIVLLVAAALAVAGCSAQRAEGDPRVIDMVSASGQKEVLLRPPGEVRGLVVFMHGVGSTQEQLLVDDGLFPLRDALLRAGFAIVASNAHGDNMGNPASVQDQLDAVGDARSRIDGIDRVDILAFSMGGFDALLTAASHRMTQLRSIALLSPAVDQTAFLNGPYAPKVIAAFGDPPVADVPALVQSSDPLAQPAGDYSGYTYHFWHSPDDTVVPADQTKQMVAHLATGGVRADVTALTGDHGDLSALDPAAVVHQFTADSV